jgi:hypothetical protein
LLYNISRKKIKYIIEDLTAMVMNSDKYYWRSNFYKNDDRYYYLLLVNLEKAIKYKVAGYLKKKRKKFTCYGFRVWIKEDGCYVADNKCDIKCGITKKYFRLIKF